jgi:hypothetical protein
LGGARKLIIFYLFYWLKWRSRLRHINNSCGRLVDERSSGEAANERRHTNCGGQKEKRKTMGL